MSGEVTNTELYREVVEVHEGENVCKEEETEGARGSSNNTR